MARRGENIYKRKDGRYEGRYVMGKTEKGKTRFGYVYAHSYGEVRAMLILKKARALGHHCAGQAPGRGTYGEWVDGWLADMRPRIRASTYASYQVILRHLKCGLGQRPVASLEMEELQRFMDGLVVRGLAASTRAGILRMLKSSLEAARAAGLIQRNPAVGVKLGRMEKCEQQVLSRGEQGRLAAQAISEGELSILLGLYLGLRVGEIAGLRWDDINWTENTLAVRRTAHRSACADAAGKTSLCVSEPKTFAARRRLPIPEFLMGMLRERYVQAGNGEGFVFGKPGRLCDPRTLQRRLEKLKRRANLPDVHFHTLRHTFATRLLEMGVDVKTVSLLLGHSSVKITLEFYAHATWEHRRQAIDQLARLVV